MANSGPDTDGSQFFVMFGAQSTLNGKHTIFGQMVGGRRTLERIEAKGTAGGRPRGRVLILQARIRVE